MAEILEKIDPDIGREDWYRIGMVLKNTYSDEGFDLWDSWSSKGS